MTSPQPLHLILPQLERAARDRVALPLLEDMAADELRDLLYEVVRTHDIELSDPAAYLARMGDRARADADAVTEAREVSLLVRAEILDCVLETLRSATGALLGPIVVDAHQREGKSNLEETIDPHLRGFELVGGLTRGQTSKTRYERSGESVWIVALAPSEAVIDHDYDPRFAIIEHHGEETVTDTGKESHAWNVINIVSVETAAEKIRDDKLEAMIEAVIKRLRSASNGKQADLATRISRATKRLEHGLRALQDYDD